MPTRPLVLFPDRRLGLPALPIETFDAAVKALAEDVRDTLFAEGALGLTAPHIGVLRRVVVVRLSPDEPVRFFVNPVVAWASPETEVHEEGSVSMPGIRERVVRPARIRIAFHDLDGGAHRMEAAGFEAAVLQHEIDQLDGIFWIDRLSRLKRERLLKRYGRRTVP